MDPTRIPPVDIDGFRESMREVGVEEIVDPTLQIFLEESQRIFADLVVAVDAGDAGIVRASAHSLKSSSSAVWAHDLAGLLQGLESAALAGDMMAISEIFRRTEPEYDAVIAHLVERGVAA